jgi:hypothetical protein
MDNAVIQGAADEAAKLVKETLASLTQAHSSINADTEDPKPPRLFFPFGIELIHFKLSFGNNINITIAIAGDKAKYPGAGAAEASALIVTNEQPTADA